MNGMLKQTALSVAVALAGVTAAFASGPDKSEGEPLPAPLEGVVDGDSCAAAFATVMAQYLKPEIDKQFPGDTAAIAEFTRGVAHAFDIKNVDAPYYMGVRSAFAMLDRLESMQSMGFPITTEAFTTRLGDALRGDAMGFNVESADRYLRDAMMAMYPEPELAALTPESQTAYLNEQKAREGLRNDPRDCCLRL